MFYEPKTVKLGCLPSRHDRRTLQLANYAPTSGKYLALVLPPAQCNYQKIKAATAWGADGNNQFGNCVIACAAHIIDSVTENESGAETPRIPDNLVVQLSRQMGALHGYNILDRLNWWRQRGMWGHQLQAFAAVALHNHPLAQFGINAFGALDIGVNLPLAWQGTATWECGTGRRFDPGSWGGHSVPILGYDATWLYACSWGGIIPMSYDAFDMYVSESYVDLLPEWFAKNNVSPSGLDVTALLSDLSQVTGDPVFDPTPPPVPDTPPAPHL